MAALELTSKDLQVLRADLDAQESNSTISYPTPDTALVLVNIPLDLVLLGASKVLVSFEMSFDTATPVVCSIVSSSGLGSGAVSRTYYSSPAAQSPMTCCWFVSLVKGVDYDDDNDVVTFSLAGGGGAGSPTLTVASNGDGVYISASYTATALP